MSLRNIATYIAALIIGYFIVEAGYRVNILSKDPRLELRSEKNPDKVTTVAYSRSLWRFNADEGFQFNDRTSIFAASVTNGRIACGPVAPLNKDGSPGISEGNYEDADVKIAVFGESFSIWVENDNLTWVNVLQRTLQQKLARSVHILNFARDGSSLLQMFDVAASQIRARKPDLAIIAFNTNAATLQRMWRVEATINGEPRVFTTAMPTQTPDPADRNSNFDTTIIHPGIDAAWCDKYKTGGALDQVGLEIIDKYFRFREERFSPFTLRRSFFWNRVVNNDAFSTEYKSIVPLDEDAKLLSSIQAIRAAHIPVLLVHLPVSIEVAARKEFFTKPQAESRVDEFRRLSGLPVYGLLKYIGPIEHPERMNSSSTNMHPSTFGMELYANSVSEIILKEGVLRR